MTENKPDRKVYDHIDLILAAMGIVIALMAVCYSLARYEYLFGHKPY